MKIKNKKKSKGLFAYHGMTVAHSGYKLLEEKPRLPPKTMHVSNEVAD